MSLVSLPRSPNLRNSHSSACCVGGLSPLLCPLGATVNLEVSLSQKDLGLNAAFSDWVT